MDIAKLLQSILGSDTAASITQEAKRLTQGNAIPGGAVGGAAAGSIMMMLLGSKKARKLGGKALSYGGTVLLAGLAYKAYTDYRSNKDPKQAEDADFPQAPPSSGFSMQDEVDTGGADFRLAIVRAMIASAKSDGHMDQTENARIMAVINEQNLSAEEKSFLLDALSHDADPVAIAALARTEQQGAELYAASRMAIDPDSEPERRYLDRLAGALRLPQALIAHLDTKVEDARRQMTDRTD